MQQNNKYISFISIYIQSSRHELCISLLVILNVMFNENKSVKMKIVVEDFINCVSEEMWQAGQYSAAKTCLAVLHGLLRVVKEPDFSFEHLTPNLLQEYEYDLSSRGCAPGTVSLYMRTLHTLCRRAEEVGGIKVPKGLFDKVFTGTVSSVRRSVSPEVVRRLSTVELVGKKKKLAFARDLFLLSIYLCGIPFVDLVHLRKCDLKDGVLSYRRRKTGRQTHIQVEPCAMEIIGRYARKDDTPGYLLPIIRRTGSREEERRQYESALRLYNKHLKALSEVLQLGVKLTSYVARHTWATTAHDIGVDIADISAALCHSSERMTLRYIRSFSLEHMAQVNRRVIACMDRRIRGGDSKNKILKRRELGVSKFSGSQ